jgi:succinate dehydrogenase / fumarate reductase cytochrome b subunit
MSTTSDTETSASPSTTSILSQRVGSFLAFAPLAVWVTWHLYSNLSAFQGPQAWEAAVTAPRAPLVEVLTSTIVLLPLVIHTLWGFRRLRMVKFNNSSYSNFDNMKFLLQRLSAVGVALFIVAHVSMARIRPLVLHGHHETFADISYEMNHNPPTLIVYLLGILGVAYHLANGVATGGLTWGYAATDKARDRVKNLSYLYFVLLLAMGWGSVFALANAGDNPRRMEQRVSAPSIPAGVQH